MNARTKAVLLVTSLVAQLMLIPAARAADHESVWFPVGPGGEGSIFTKATTSDPFDLHTSGPTGIEFTRISVDPGGTTGLTQHPGITVTMVTEGAATVLSAEAGTCGRRTVNGGLALIEPGGSATEIRNDGPGPLVLYSVAFAPAGTAPAGLSEGPCAPAAAKNAAVATLNRSVIEAPLSAESKGLSDVYVGAVRLAPHGSIIWHVQQRPLLAGVYQGEVTLDLARNDRTETGVLPAQTGFFEPPQVAHAVRNETTAPAAYYYLAFAATPQPFFAHAPAPTQR